MKQIINNKYLIVSICLAAIFAINACTSGREITTATPQEITSAINNNDWRFIAQHVSPSYGNSRNLTSEYFVTATDNKLVVALPYFGRLNSSSGALEGNPLDFTSTSFNLSKETKGDGGWYVTIKTPDPEVQTMTFTFYDNGSAQLSVTMTNRTGISYTGRVAPVK